MPSRRPKSSSKLNPCSRAFLAAAAFLATLWSPRTHAEYRVFLLVIDNPTTKESHTVESTLDPIQYPRYYSLSPGERVSYTQTWRCFGRTGDFTPYCPNPKAQPNSEIPANTP